MEAMKADYGVNARQNNELAVLYTSDSDGLLGVVFDPCSVGCLYLSRSFYVGMIRNHFSLPF